MLSFALANRFVQEETIRINKHSAINIALYGSDKEALVPHESSTDTNVLYKITISTQPNSFPLKVANPVHWLSRSLKVQIEGFTGKAGIYQVDVDNLEKFVPVALMDQYIHTFVSGDGFFANLKNEKWMHRYLLMLE
jgi:hypothetical protein